LAKRPRNLGERLKLGAKWSGAEILLNLPVRLGTLAILARLLSPAEFGVFAAAVTVIEFARPLGTLSMDHALVQSKNLSRGSIAFASLFALGLSSLIAAIVALNANTVLLLYDDPEVPDLVVALALSGPLAAMSGLLLAVLRRKLAFRELSVVALLSSATASLASVAVAAAGWGVWALVAGYYVDLALRALFALFLVRPNFVRPRIGEETRGLLRFGIGSTLSVMLNFWALHGDYIVVGSALGPKPLGYYSRAYQLISIVPGMLGHLHNMVLFPAFSRAQSDPGYLKKALLVGTEATAALTLPLCAWGLVLGPEIIFVLLGPGWEEAVVPFQILSLGIYLRAGYRFAASMIMATGHVFYLSACQGIYGILVVVGALLGAQWGIVGVAMATLAALLVFYLLLYALTARVSGASAWSFVGAHARPTLVFAIVLVAALFARGWLIGLEWPPLAILVTAVTLGIVALIGATYLLGSRLWGDFLHQQGLTAFGRYTPPPTEVENQEHDDLSA
jgi:PST family polysaccharide transporter